MSRDLRALLIAVLPIVRLPQVDRKLKLLNAGLLLDVICTGVQVFEDSRSHED